MNKNLKASLITLGIIGVIAGFIYGIVFLIENYMEQFGIFCLSLLLIVAIVGLWTLIRNEID